MRREADIRRTHQLSGGGMTWKVLIVCCVLAFQALPDNARAQSSFSPARLRAPMGPRLAALQLEVTRGNRSALDEFWRDVERTGTPLLESIPEDPDHMLVTFVWQANGPTSNVVIMGRSGWGDPSSNQL